MFEAAEDVLWPSEPSEPEPLPAFSLCVLFPVPLCPFDEVPEDWPPVDWPVPDSPLLPFDASDASDESDEDESDDCWSSDDCAVDVDLSDDALPATCTVGTLLDCPRRYMTNAPPATTTATVTMMAMINATNSRDDGPLPADAATEEPDVCVCAEVDAGADDGTGTARTTCGAATGDTCVETGSRRVGPSVSVVLPIRV